MSTTTTTTAPAKWPAPQYGKCARCEADADLRRGLLDSGRVAEIPATDLAGLNLSCIHCGQWERMRWAAIEQRATRGDTPTTAPPQGWPVLAEDAYHGLAGQIVRAIEPQSEADPVALLVQLLVAFGSAVGRGPHLQIESDRHYANLFAVLVGATATGRKGTSWGRVRETLAPAAPEWVKERIVSGLSSSEGLIWAVRDPIISHEKIKEKGRVVGTQEYEADPGVTDKRLLVLEPEFSNVLKQTERQGNTLSALLRQSWERGDLQTLTRNTPAKATGAHISIVGHITDAELRRCLTATETANGFANRFLFFAARRSKCLPFGGESVDLKQFTHPLRTALSKARTIGAVSLDSSAREIWQSVYPSLSEGKPGIVGAVCGRAAPQTLRLAVVYALLDQCDTIRPDHLTAALALWDYAESSARMIFGDASGDDVADAILDALRDAPEGMTRTQVSDLFGRNRSAARIDAALSCLKQAGLATYENRTTGGREAEAWMATK